MCSAQHSKIDSAGGYHKTKRAGDEEEHGSIPLAIHSPTWGRTRAQEHEPSNYTQTSCQVSTQCYERRPSFEPPRNLLKSSLNTGQHAQR